MIELIDNILIVLICFLFSVIMIIVLAAIILPIFGITLFKVINCKKCDKELVLFYFQKKELCHKCKRNNHD